MNIVLGIQSGRRWATNTPLTDGGTPESRRPSWWLPNPSPSQRCCWTSDSCTKLKLTRKQEIKSMLETKKAKRRGRIPLNLAHLTTYVSQPTSEPDPGREVHGQLPKVQRTSQLCLAHSSLRTAQPSIMMRSINETRPPGTFVVVESRKRGQHGQQDTVNLAMGYHARTDQVFPDRDRPGKFT